MKDWFGAGQALFKRQDKVNNLPYFDFSSVPEHQKHAVRARVPRALAWTLCLLRTPHC